MFYLDTWAGGNEMPTFMNDSGREINDSDRETL